MTYVFKLKEKSGLKNNEFIISNTVFSFSNLCLVCDPTLLQLVYTDGTVYTGTEITIPDLTTPDILVDTSSPLDFTLFLQTSSTNLNCPFINKQRVPLNIEVCGFENVNNLEKIIKYKFLVSIDADVVLTNETLFAMFENNSTTCPIIGLELRQVPT